ncbi:hypothetical protein RHGRI_018281 [Rhododendron griersonianum]|uniref:DNA polymerase delta subunit 3 n=1 Tax=Rhododendron griersonianum TaxID=479676 RepID=A0AAV6K0V8_9ERIC|nr:hypothetical protein RHGRI_018281 [Rhododendron griersonianum]
MAEVETLGILEEIEALVSDKLQVVSYKWLSRNFLLPSDSSKRLLHKFVEKHGDAMEVVYALSGWLKNNPSVYHIRLVSGPKLAEAKQDFDGSCSVHVYSVQACIPKDPAALWNAEYVQAEELFRQPPTTDNCLRDNRLCRISNSFVKRSTEGTAASIAVPQLKTAGMAGPSRSNPSNQNLSIPQPQQKKVQQSNPKVGQQPTHVVKDIKTESPVTEGHKQVAKGSSDKEKVPQLPANKKKGQNEKSTSGNGGSLANMWDRASTKPKPSTATTKTTIIIPNTTGLFPFTLSRCAEAQICVHEAVEAADSDDDGEDFNFKRASNGEGSRKRRVVFDFSDEDDEFKDAVNLASPDPPKRKSFLDKQSSKSSVPEKNNFDIDKEKENKPKAKEDKIAEKAINQAPPRADSSLVSKGKTAEISSLEKVHSPIPENNAKDKETNAAPTSPKRRKVMKTRIDERGREVTEVVWEGEEAETKADSHAVTKTENTSANNTVNRAPAAKKSPAMGNTAPSNPGGKAGNKKAGNLKDPKQGNIMSFFKKV